MNTYTFLEHHDGKPVLLVVFVNFAKEGVQVVDMAPPERMTKLIIPWILYQLVAQITMRTNGLKQGFRFVKGIWLHRKSSQIHFFFSRKRLFYIICAHSEMSNNLI